MKQNLMMKELKAFMADANFPWAVCGGFALDLFLDKTIRTHGDIDVCVFEPDRPAVLRYMLSHAWTVYEFRGQGKVRPLDGTALSEPGRNLMCLKEDCSIVRFYPCEDEGLLYHQFFHTGLASLNYIEFLFGIADGEKLVFDGQRGLVRALSKAILSRDGIPYLAPEVALLHKASNADNPDYQYDFAQTYPSLNDDQRAWFSNGLDVLYPCGHPWKGTDSRMVP